MSDESIIRRSAAELDRIRASLLTDTQLQANVDCYQYATATANVSWRDTCMAEISARSAR